MAEDQLNTRSACGSWHCGLEVAEHVACSMRILKKGEVDSHQMAQISLNTSEISDPALNKKRHSR